jgi:hypothetical protein
MASSTGESTAGAKADLPPILPSALIFPSKEWKQRVKLSELLREMKGVEKQQQATVEETAPLIDSEEEDDGGEDDSDSDWEDYDDEYSKVHEAIENIQIELKFVKSFFRRMQHRQKGKSGGSDKRFLFTASPEAIILAVHSLGWLINSRDRRMFEKAVLKEQRELNEYYEKRYDSNVGGKPSDSDDVID